ncbi:MAG: hypothetical protein M1833_006133 [Piccolia ochrophora]|nr:MAG: hypothetical protein M1833_006133 [Piccolia ochrophora]
MNSKADDTIYFWKPEQEDGFLGQWYPSPFTARTADGEEIHYQNAEQYMMHHKGLLFAPDSPITASILTTPDVTPRTIKQLGRQIPDFVESEWHEHRFSIVVDANLLKFTQDPRLKKLLLDTGDKALVEASPRDRIWGIGFGKKNAPAQRARWGQNLLGKALMEARERIRIEEQSGVTEV